MTKFIPQFEPWFGKEEKKAVCDYMDEGGWITEFRRTQKFEQMIAKYTGAKHCVVVNNGTVSLTLAALACGIKTGDEVIVPNFTMIATPNSIKLIGANPVFVDIEPNTLVMDYEKTVKAITKKTKAIMLVTVNGRYPAAGINKFKSLTKKYNLHLIEDSAQSLGSFYPNGKHMGTEGIVGCFSFSAPKVISTGQGGALITNDDNLATKIRRLKDFGRSKGGNDIHDAIGYNFKFTELQACIGIEQIKKLRWRVDRKQKILQLYQRLLKDLRQVRFFSQDLVHTTPWFIDVLVENRDKLQEYLKKNNIGTRIMYPPINRQPAYKYPGTFKVSNLVGEKGLWLPSSSQLTNDDIKYVAEKIRGFYQASI